MTSFRESADITGNKLTHMAHSEDLFLYGGRASHFAIEALKDVYETLKGGAPTKNITTKIDGAPSVIAATDFNGDAFVATKGFFNKDRKMAMTQEQVQTLYGHAPDLARKMSKLLEHIHSINIPRGEIWQGDFLFDSDTLKEEKIGGEEMISFHPNTIIYAVPKKDPLAYKIKRADIGVAWHTVYKGKTYDTLKISFTADVDNLSPAPVVFQIDSKIKNLPRESLLSSTEELQIQKQIEKIENIYAEIEDFIENINEPLQKYLSTFKNYLIKTHQKETSETFIKEMLAWIEAAFNKEIEKKKRPETKQAYEDKKIEQLNEIRNSREKIQKLIDLQTTYLQVKNSFIKKLDTLGTFRTFVKELDKGFLPVGEEGYAISDVYGNIQKFVSRLDFSKNNFSQNIVKGWMSDARMRNSIKRTFRKKLSEGTVSVKDLADEIINQMRDELPGMTKAQLITLRHEMLSLLGKEIKIMSLLEPLAELFGNFKKDLIPLLYNNFRSIDERNLKIFLESTREEPIISVQDILGSKGKVMRWEPFLNARLASLKFSPADITDITNAVASTYFSFAGGTAGMGKGEVLYAILCGGRKPDKGDVNIPGFGNVELKGDSGRMKGVGKVAPSNNNIPYKMIKDYIKDIPELEPLNASSSTSFGLKKTGKNNIVYLFIKNNMKDEARDIIENIFNLWFEGSYGENLKTFNADMSLIPKITDSIMREDWLEAIAYQAALQYDIYKKAEGFEGILFVSPSSFYFVESPEDLVNGTKTGKLILKQPASLSVNNNIGAAAGLNISQR